MVKGVSRSSDGFIYSARTPTTSHTGNADRTKRSQSTQLNGHQGFGVMAGLNLSGVNSNDPNMVCIFFVSVRSVV
jgi:ubiquilin